MLYFKKLGGVRKDSRDENEIPFRNIFQRIKSVED
jgi:hypothetical protein